MRSHHPTRPITAWALAATLSLAPLLAGALEAPLAGDTCVTTARPTCNVGRAQSLKAGEASTALLRFDLSVLPVDFHAEVIHLTR